MRIAVIGSREALKNASLLILKQMPVNISEMVSGGANGIDQAAAEVANTLNVPLKLFLPDYERYGKRAPLVRNLEIIEYADEVVAFWNGRSRGTQHVIASCLQRGKPVRVIPLP